MLNFDNANKTVTITVTAENGMQQAWKINMNAITVDFVGVWKINNTWIYGGQEAWNYAAVFGMLQKSWKWVDATGTGPGAEHDNILTFTVLGVDADGNPHGKVVNDAGADGLFADYIFIGDATGNPGNHDLNGIYRVIQEGESTWVLDIDGNITFTKGDKTSVCKFGGASDFDDYKHKGKAPFGDTWDGALVTAAEVASLLANKSFYFDIYHGDPEINDLYDKEDNRYMINPRFYWIEVKR